MPRPEARGARRTAVRVAQQWLPPIVYAGLRRTRKPRPEDEWVYRGAPWPEGDAGPEGWDASGVARTSLEQWPAFAKSLEGVGPVAHDYRVHNTVMTFAYVLARAADGAGRMSMLDWGGGLGWYLAYARALLPELEVDYHCRDLPRVTAAGRRVLPQATFHDSDDSAFARSFDLVMASSSLQYSRDWRAILARLASASEGYLYVTRQPFVEHAASFVVEQRADRYGYGTAYPGWFLNRDEFLDAARDDGLQLVREFLIDERPYVPGASEQADYRGFLFRPIAARATS